MAAIAGLVGLRPRPEHVARVTTPPYDVIKEGSPLAARLASNPDSLYHVILGDRPREALDGLIERAVLIPDDEPALYVFEQRWQGEQRTGVYLALEVSEYSERNVIRHEKTFDAKVQGRIALARATEHTIGPVFLLTRAALAPLLERAKESAPLYDFTSDFARSSPELGARPVDAGPSRSSAASSGRAPSGGPSALDNSGGTDLHGVRSRVWRVPSESELGAAITACLAPHPLYIADGHHRYHAALRNGQSHVLAYVTPEARILAYDRVVNGVRSFAEARHELALEPLARFETPPKHAFALRTRDGSWLLRAKHVPGDVVGRLDCAILERELYPHLGLTHDHIIDPAHFDYYPESQLDEMEAVVDAGTYELAIALHPVSIDELMAVADAGLEDSSVVMPEKSTFFSPKILSGLFLYRHQPKR